MKADFDNPYSHDYDDSDSSLAPGVYIRDSAVLVHFGSPSGTRYSVPRVKIAKKKRRKKNGSK